VKNILPTLKNEILAHNGCFLVRGDSGDCVRVVTDTVFALWDIFGGAVNSKGYKVLDPHVKALYGDSITIERAENIYRILEENGFAAQNVSLGVGSFSMHCIEEDREDGSFGTDLLPFTRDTFGVAIKAVYAEFTDENGNVSKIPVYKDPKTDRDAGGGHFKKSQKGCCSVIWKDKWTKDLTYVDGLTWEESMEDTLMRTVFKNGELVEEETLNDIRQRLNNGKF
jgi:nicotinamide phosphoribosyltransferase